MSPSRDLDARVAAHFENEFLAFAEDDRDMDDPALLEYVFASRTGIDPRVYEKLPGDPYRTSLDPGDYRADLSFLEGKVVLDAGCGPGRFTSIAARAGARLVVGLDLGEHVDRAAERTEGLDNVVFVQGSVLAPPLRPGSFDYVFCIGVVHHTGDARAATRALAGLVAPGGALSIWVYPPEYWGGKIRGPVNRFVHRRLSRLPPARALRFCARYLYRLGRIQMWAARRAATKALFAPLFAVSVPRHPRREVMIATIYDYFCPPTITTHTYDEVAGWARDAGLGDVRRLPVPTAIFARRL